MFITNLGNKRDAESWWTHKDNDEMKSSGQLNFSRYCKWRWEFILIIILFNHWIICLIGCSLSCGNGNWNHRWNTTKSSANGKIAVIQVIENIDFHLQRFNIYPSISLLRGRKTKSRITFSFFALHTIAVPFFCSSSSHMLLENTIYHCYFNWPVTSADTFRQNNQPTLTSNGFDPRACHCPNIHSQSRFIIESTKYPGECSKAADLLVNLISSPAIPRSLVYCGFQHWHNGISS